MRVCYLHAWPLLLLVFMAPVTACGTELYVDPSGGGDFTTIIAALDAAADGDTIVVACGTYREPLIDIRKNIAIRSETRNPECVTLDGQGTHLIMASHYMGPSKYIEGFTFINGYQGATHDNAGALGCWQSHATVRNCVFRDNVCANQNGGALAICANMFVENCRFYDNQAYFDGGALYCLYCGGGGIRDCHFENNHAGLGVDPYSGGGAIGMFDANTVIERCTFVGNSAGYGGAIIVSYGSDIEIASCTFVNNESLPVSNDSGSVEVGYGCTVSLDKCIVAFDQAGGGVVCRYDGTEVLTCCDLFGNEGGDWIGCVSDEFGVAGNISANPLFCGDASADEPWAIHENSPCSPEYSPCGELIGSHAIGCGSSSAVDRSWGAIKSLYR